MEKIEFKDLPDTTTPFTADIFNEMQDNIENAINAIYPVGSIYMNVNNVNPSTLFGGEWEQLPDRFLLGAGTNHEAGETGGKESVTLSANIGACNSAPSVIGYLAEGQTNYQKNNNADIVVQGSSTSFSNWNHSTPVTDRNSTSRETAIMPPYLVVYMWKRIS